MFWQPADEEFPQRTFHHGAQGAVALGEALIEDGPRRSREVDHFLALALAKSWPPKEHDSVAGSGNGVLVT